MKKLFIEAKRKLKPDSNNILEISKKLPERIAIAYSVQYKDYASDVRGMLSKKHKITKFIQILGCSRPIIPGNTKAILLISDGRFHAVSLSYETKLPVYLLEDSRLEKVSDSDIKSLERKQKASYTRFLNSESVGILVSTKPGQQNLKRALSLKKKLTGKNKKSYLFICNNINPEGFENFPSIDSWVNTACPRMDTYKEKQLTLISPQFRDPSSISSKS